MKRVLSPTMKNQVFKTWFFGRRVLRAYFVMANLRNMGETIMIKKVLVFTLVVVMCAFASSALAKDMFTATQTVKDGVVTVKIKYTGKINALGFKAYLPEGVSYESVIDTCNVPDVKKEDKLEFAWTTIPASPMTFSYKVSGEGNIGGEVMYRRDADEIVVPVP